MARAYLTAENLTDAVRVAAVRSRASFVVLSPLSLVLTVVAVLSVPRWPETVGLAVGGVVCAGLARWLSLRWARLSGVAEWASARLGTGKDASLVSVLEGFHGGKDPVLPPDVKAPAGYRAFLEVAFQVPAVVAVVSFGLAFGCLVVVAGVAPVVWLAEGDAVSVGVVAAVGGISAGFHLVTALDMCRRSRLARVAHDSYLDQARSR